MRELEVGMEGMWGICVEMWGMEVGIWRMSSNVNEVIRAILNFFIFFTKRFYTHKKHKKHKDATKQKHKKHKKNTRHKKHKKHKKHKTYISEQSTFFPLDVF